MKKVVLAIPYHSSFRAPLRHGFEQLGFEVLEIDYRFLRGNLKFNEDLLTIFYQSVITLGLNLLSLEKGHEYQSRFLNQYILKKSQQFRPDIFFVVKGENLSVQTIETLKEKNIKTVCWLVDYMFQNNVWPWFKKIGPHFDLVLQTETGIEKKVAKLKWKNKRGIMLHAADPNIRKMGSIESEKKYDVVFVGTYNSEREKLLLGLKKFGLKVWGYSWEKSQLKDVYMGKLPYQLLIPTYAQSKIVVANNQSTHTPFTNRIYEAASGKAFVLLEYNKLIKKVPNLGKFIITYRSAKDLEKLVKYYLTHDNEREKRADELYKVILKNHLYDLRLRQALKEYL